MHLSSQSIAGVDTNMEISMEAGGARTGCYGGAIHSNNELYDGERRDCGREKSGSTGTYQARLG